MTDNSKPVTEMTDAELDRWVMEPDPPLYYVSDCELLSGTWHCKCADDGEIIIRQRATASLDIAALVEAKVIERVGCEEYTEQLERVLWPNLIPVANDPFQRIDVYMFITATARQRVMACYEAMREHNARTEGEAKGEG